MGIRYKLVTSNASLREIKLLRELTHPNIVTLRDQFVNLDDMSLALVYDYGACALQHGRAPCSGRGRHSTHTPAHTSEQPRRTCA